MVSDPITAAGRETGCALACDWLRRRAWECPRVAIVVGAGVLVGSVFSDALVVYAAGARRAHRPNTSTTHPVEYENFQH